MNPIRFIPFLALPFLIHAAYAEPATPSGGASKAEQASGKDQAATWLAEVSAKAPLQEAQLLRRAQATLLGNIVKCDGWKPYRGIMPSLGTYRGVWNWDSAFHAVALSHWDPAFAREQFDILFDKQRPNGMLPDVIWENGTMVIDFTKPPVMAWAVAVVDHRSPDTDNLRKLYPKLVKLGEFWLKERGGNTDGLCFYAGTHAGNESGWDNAIRWDGGYQTSRSDDKRLWAIDLNCYMVSHYRAMAYMAGRLDLADDQKKWLAEAETLARRINEKLWDEARGTYVDVDRQTGKPSPVLSVACFMPLFLHIAPPDRAAKMARLGADPNKFFPGMPTAAYDTPGFSSNAMWRGPAWLNTSYFAIKGLQDYGCADLAGQMRTTLLGWVAKDTASIREYYQPKTGQGLAAKAFGWSAAFTISFILDWDNDNLTRCFPKAPALAAEAIAAALPPPPAIEIDLPASAATLHGNGARLDGTLIQHWDDVGTFASWRLLVAAGEAEVVVLQAAEAVSAGHAYQVEIAGQILPGIVKDTGGWTAVQPVSLGKVKLEKAGEIEIVLRPLKKGARGVMNLQGILLRGPAAAQAALALPPALPRGDYFPKKKYTPEPLPTFEQVKDKLPEPVLPSHPEWQAMYWKCWQLAFAHLRQPKPGSPLVSNWLDEAFSGNIFQWDTCFMMMFARYGHAQFPFIQSLDNFYCRQRTNGYICREYVETDGREIKFGHHGRFDDPHGWKNSVNPPLFAWAECESFKVTGDKSRFELVLPVLEKYVECLDRDGNPDAGPDTWLEQGRRSAGTPHQLYWNTDLGSGMDDIPKPANKGSGWVDMSCQMVMQYNELALICREIGKPEKAVRFEAEAKAIGDRINQWCWNEQDGFYYDVLADGTQFKKKTACGFWPMLAGIASPDQVKRMVAHLKNEKEFWRPFVFPALAADEKEYNFPTGGYWKGAVWAPTNYAIIKGLEACGEEKFAAEATEKYLAAMAEVFKKRGTVFENYMPEKFEPQSGKGDFVGWTGCGPIALYIENVLGFRPDGVRNTLNWNLRLAEPHGINRLRFGAITTDLAYDGKGTVTVKSDKPYTLVVNGAKFEVKPGDNRFDNLKPN
jgi:neutral trehalase